ncbi:GAF domain-containing protein [Chloroflexota bacterium]
MTEQHKPEQIENTSLEGLQSPPGTSASAEDYEKTLSRLYLFGTIIISLLLLDSLVTYGIERAWQVLVDASGFLTALIVLQISRRAFRNKNYQLAEILLPPVIFLALLPGEFVYTGITLFNLISGTILLLLFGLSIRPKNTSLWVGYGIFFFIAVLFGNQFGAVDRFNITQTESWQSLGWWIFTGIFFLAVIQQLIRLLQKSTIRTRLLVSFVGLGLIPAIIAAASSGTLGFQYAREQVSNRLQSISEVREVELDTFFLTQQTALFDILNQNATGAAFFRLAVTQATANVESTYLAILQGLQDEVVKGNFSKIWTMDSDGFVVVSTDPNQEDLNFSGAQYFQNARTNNYVQPASINQATGEAIIIISAPIHSSTGAEVGVIAGRINIDKINQILLQETPLTGETSLLYIVNRDNYLISSHAGIGSSLEMITLQSDGISTGLENRTNGFNTYKNYRNEDVAGAYTYLPDLDSVLMVEELESEAFRPILLNLWISGSITLIALLIAIILATASTRSISRPLSNLADTATAVAGGNLDREFIVDRQDEVGELSIALNQMTRQLRQSLMNLESIVAERTSDLERRARYLEATAEVGRATTQIHNLDDLLTSVTHLISEQFGFYHVGVFLLDELDDFAVLRATNSEGGWRMLARGHKLRVGEQGIVGFVTGMRQPRVQQQVGGDEVYYDNPDLPLTRSELALPLLAGGELLGALDVQSTQEQAFSSEDVDVLQILADEVAMAIYNTRLFEQLQKSLETERRIFGELSREGWQEILQRQQTIKGYTSSVYSGTQEIDQPLSPFAQQAMQQNRIIQPPFSPDGEFYPLAIPISVRGDTVVAVLETKKPMDDGPWKKDEITAIQAIVEQLGIALENARLFEETQRLAQRERIAADVSGKVWSSSNVNTILQTAVQELARALNASQGTIRLRMPDENGQDQSTTIDFGELEE